MAAGYTGERGQLAMHGFLGGAWGSDEVASKGVGLMNIVSFGMVGWNTNTSAQMDVGLDSLMFRQKLWGYPIGLYIHMPDFTGTQIFQTLAGLGNHGSTVKLNTELRDWMLGSWTAIPNTTPSGVFFQLPQSGPAFSAVRTVLSPDIGAGQNLGAPWNYDINGVQRTGAWDIGAYQMENAVLGGGAGSGYAIVGKGNYAGQSQVNYSGSSTSTANPGQISAIFNASSPVNSTAYDTSINSSPFDCYTRVTDGTTWGGLSVGTNSPSGGSNDDNFQGAYATISNTGGASYVFQFDLSGVCGKVINTGNLNTLGGIWYAGGVAFSHTPGVLFNFTSHSTAPYSVISKNVLTSYKASTVTNFPDVTGGTVCPGLPIGKPTWNSLLAKSDDDDKFGLAMSFTGGQDTGYWGVEWSQTLGCRVVNLGTFDATTNPLGGKYWDWCTGGSCTPTTPPTGNLSTASSCTNGTNCTCSGILIHGAQMSGDGNYLMFSLATGSRRPTAGACTGLTNNTQFTIWTPGTGTTQYCSNDISGGPGGQYCGGHNSVGYHHVITETNGVPGYSTIRDLSNVLNYTHYFTPVNYDTHGHWPAGTLDVAPRVSAVDISFPTDGSGCAAGVSAVYCPVSPKGQIIASFPNAVNQPLVHFGHTFGCNPTTTTYANCQGPEWSSSTSYCINCIITPKLGNPGNYTFQNQGSGACTPGGSEPGTWNQTIGGTQTDGGCTWTNVNLGMGDYYFGCNNSIITVSQDGNWALIASGMFLGLGMDSSNRFRCDVFLVHLGHSEPPALPQLRVDNNECNTNCSYELTFPGTWVGSTPPSWPTTLPYANTTAGVQDASRHGVVSHINSRASQNAAAHSCGLPLLGHDRSVHPANEHGCGRNYLWQSRAISRSVEP
jgi:hypothetical protein